NSQYINSNEVTSEVGGNKTTIRGGFFESSGTYQRTWLGITTANQIDIRSENGYLRFRNNTLDRSIYMSDYGVSTMRDATGDYLDADGSSGSLLFWDPRYSPNGAYGLTVNPYGGVVALESDNNRIVLNSELSSNIESRNNVINITPHSQQTSRGFRFTKSTDYLDGYLVFGDVNQRGLRFNRSTSGLVQVVDANRNTGGDTAIEAGNGIFNTVRARDGSNYLNLHNANMFRVGVDSDGSARVTSNVIYRRTYSSPANVHITSQDTIGRSVSALKYKYFVENQFNTEQEQLEHSKKILQIKPKTWYDKEELSIVDKEIRAGERLSSEEFKIKRYFGAITDDLHEIGLTELVHYNENNEVEGLAYDRMSVHHNVLIKDLYDENDTLKSEIKELNNKLNKIMEMIS